MRKEAFDAILSLDGTLRDSGPIEDHLEAIATEQQLPDLAIGVCTARIEESAPALLDVLCRAADGEPLSEDEAWLLLRGIHILGGARQAEAFQPLLRFLRRPVDEVEGLIGDAASESLAQILAGAFDGDADALFEAIADRSIDEFGRHACLGAATFLTFDGRIEHARMHALLERFYAERLATDCNFAWIGWLEAVALLGYRDLAPLVHRAWDEERIPDYVIERKQFEENLSAAEQAPGDLARFEKVGLGYIEDVLVALDWTRAFDVDPEEADRIARWTPSYEPQTPVTNPWRHVGRNDPCPCGSGKKAKKCCMPV